MEERPLRHAYLIMTHGNFPILEKQLRFLDSENADFFIHADAGARDFEPDRFRAVPRRSKVTFTRRRRIAWGHDSQIWCELDLLRAAAKGRYDYYHLLSGVDVPVKPRRYIEEYFRRDPTINYVNFNSPTISPRHLDRVRYYYPFQGWNLRTPLFRRAVRELTAGAQRLAGTDRLRDRPSLIFQKGANWFSITDALAAYLLDREGEIREIFRDTCCGDELFLQTMVVNSPFRDTLPPNAFDDDYAACCRYIDWERGSPYTFTEDDLDELLHTGPDFLFARKFDYAAHPEAVDRLFAYFGEAET